MREILLDVGIAGVFPISIQEIFLYGWFVILEFYNAGGYSNLCMCYKGYQFNFR